MDPRIVIASLSFIGIAAIVTGQFFVTFWRYWRVRNWPTVEGVVLESRIMPESGGKYADYDCHVEYEYSVDGVRYVSSRVGISLKARRSGYDAQEALRPYRKGFSTTAHYNPKNPAEAIVAPQIPFRFMIVCVIAASLTLGLGISLLFLK